MIKNIMKNIGTEKAGMPEKMKQAYIDHAKKIGVDSLESLIRNKDKAYVDYNDEIAQIYADELEARNRKEVTEDSPTPEAWKTGVIAKLDTSKLLEMDKNFENYKKTMNSVDKLAQERNDIVKAELKKRNSK